MGWRVCSVVEERAEFVRLMLAGGLSIAELCRRFGVSRDTGHRLLRRHAALGAAGLVDGSRRPHVSPRRTEAGIEAAVLALREAHPAWGGRKLARRLRDLGHAGVPAPSTVTAILRRHGRLAEAGDGPHRGPWRRFAREAPNLLWQMDFKGHFALAQGRCHALTLLDDHCRYALALRACGDERMATVQRELTGVFRRHGLPETILADNGPPWGSAGHHGCPTALGVWLMQLGVKLIHGRPRHPQTQGKDERFHRTLDVELLQHNHFADEAACQAGFDAWRRVYNEERPHEALDLATPASRYRPSPRGFPETLPAIDYHAGDVVRRVGRDGTFAFRGGAWKTSQAFAGQRIALRPTHADGVWTLFFSRFAIGQIDLADRNQGTQTVRHLSEHPSDLCPV